MSFIILLIFQLSVKLAHAAEESLDLNSVTESPTQKSIHESIGHLPPINKWSIMGRVDWNAEIPNYKQASPGSNEVQYNTKHFFGFLKVKASDKVEFFGEIFQQTFFDVRAKINPELSFHFGKILVPFGDNSGFHLYYGGFHGAFFPDVLAAEGLNLESHIKDWNFDLYTVSLKNLSGDLAMQTAALGTRIQNDSINQVHLIASVIQGDRVPGHRNLFYALDATSDYGLLSERIKLSAGRAVAQIEKPVDNSPSYKKSGDYLQSDIRIVDAQYTAWNAPLTMRIRYGTYVNDSREVTQKDFHDWTLGVRSEWDVIKWNLEYQWTMEEINEIQNDNLRLQIALDF